MTARARVRLPAPADFSALPDQAIVRIIALLRECSSVGARVIWSLVLGPDQHNLIRQLDQLPAPDTIVGLEEGAPSAVEWRSSSSFGLLYFRKGPKFLSVVDQRAGLGRRVIVDDPATMGVFVQALDGCAWSEVTRTPQSAAVARDLLKKGLFLRVGDQCVTLPYTCVHGPSEPFSWGNPGIGRKEIRRCQGVVRTRAHTHGHGGGRYDGSMQLSSCLSWWRSS
ncbi:DUF5825 family protein [Streptomyces lavendofoliae]|uniref:DUF5825 family protein n=1 Tax=Streptomyces lavendofoliae TaxID=67314 RepID=UPI003D8D3827